MQILGVGLEIVDQQAWARQIRKLGPSFFKEHFTARERAYCDRKRSPLAHYSARWACKLALLRALGFPGHDLQMKAIEVSPGRVGLPRLRWTKTLAAKKPSWKIRAVKASLTHSDRYSAAEVIVLGEEKD